MVRLIKDVLKKHPKIINGFPFNNSIKGKVNIQYEKTRMTHSKINDMGKGNNIIFTGSSILKNCKIYFYGNNNTIRIGDGCFLNEVTLWLEDNSNSIIIGNNTVMTGKIQIATIEETNVIIGNDCLFSSNISIRTGDSHSITNLDGMRTNLSEDIEIGEHVWVCQNVMIQKGVKIADNNIVGAGAIVTHSIKGIQNAILAGIPARIVKKDANWDIKRI